MIKRQLLSAIISLSYLVVNAASHEFERELQQQYCHEHEDGRCSHCHEPCDYGDVFFQWNCIALEANVIDHNGPEPSGDDLSLTQGPPSSARALAMIHTAMFDAYNVVSGPAHYETYIPNLRSQVNGSGASVEAAVAQAAHDVMAKLYKGVELIEDMIDEALQRTLQSIPSASQRNRGVEVGEQVAALCMQDRINDGYDPSDPYLMDVEYVPSGEPGQHDVDPQNMHQGFFNPGAGMMKPFGMTNTAEYRAPIPPGLVQNGSGGYTFDENNPEYMEALLEVKELGVFRGGMENDPFPSSGDDPGYEIGNFWSYNGSPCTGTPPRLYNMIARRIAIDMNNKLDDNALLFTILNVGLGDAGITSWDSKYHYKLWRPINGIRGHSDPSMRDPNWMPLGASRSNLYDGEQNFSPPFPAYTSGHATFGAVALKTLMNFYYSSDMSFSFISDEWNGLTLDQFERTRPVRPRNFSSYTMAMAENAASRVFNGVHWRFDGTYGVEAGCKIADYIYENMFLSMNGKKKRTATPTGQFEEAINCILQNPDYMNTPGVCNY